MRGTLSYLDVDQGDVKKTWDRGKAHEVEDARATFENLVKEKKYLAYTVKRGDKRGDLIKEFDPNLEAIFLVPQSAGG